MPTIVLSDTTPSMIPPDQYPRDEYNARPSRKPDALMTIEVREHQLLYDLYLTLYRHKKRQVGKAKTKEKLLSCMDALDAFYNGENKKKKACGRN